MCFIGCNTVLGLWFILFLFFTIYLKLKMAQISISKCSHLFLPHFYFYFFVVSFPGNFPFSYILLQFSTAADIYVHTGNISCTCVGLSLRSLYVCIVCINFSYYSKV